MGNKPEPHSAEDKLYAQKKDPEQENQRTEGFDRLRRYAFFKRDDDNNQQYHHAKRDGPDHVPDPALRAGRGFRGSHAVGRQLFVRGGNGEGRRFNFLHVRKR